MAKWGSNQGGMRLDANPTPYTCQVVDVKKTISKKRKDDGKDPDQFEWGIQVWVGGRWEQRKLWTGCSFQDPATISGPQYVPKLMKLVRACKQVLPTTQAQAEAWSENGLVGHRFGILMQANPEDPSKIIDYIVPLPEVAGQASPGTSATPAQVAAPVQQAALVSAPAPAPAPYVDPFEGDPGAATPAPVGAPATVVAGSESVW